MMWGCDVLVVMMVAVIAMTVVMRMMVIVMMAMRTIGISSQLNYPWATKSSSDCKI